MSCIRPKSGVALQYVGVLILGFLVGNCGDGVSGPEADDAHYHLRVVAGDDVRGEPAAGSVSYEAGREVVYSFQPAPGYRELHVTIDGQPVPSSGVVRMDSAHTLQTWAVADIELSDLGRDLKSRVESLPNSSDPQADLGEVLSTVEEIYDRSELNDGRRQVTEAMASLQLSPEERRRITEALRGTAVQVGESGPGSGTQIPSRSLALNHSTSDSDPSHPSVAFVYVNGIWNSLPEASQSAVELNTLVEGLNLPSAETHLFYNASETGDLIQCYLDKLPRLITFTDVGGWLSLFEECDQTPDLLEALQQIANLEANFEDGVTPLGEELALFIQTNFLDVGSKVVLVAHSQGNLVVQEALFGSGIINPESRRNNIGVISLGAPVQTFTPDVGGFESLLVEHEVLHLATNLDLVAMNLTEPLTTELSIKAEPDLGDALACVSNCLWASAIQLKWALHLHSFVASYMAAIQSRTLIREAALKQYVALVLSDPVEYHNTTTFSSQVAPTLIDFEDVSTEDCPALTGGEVDGQPAVPAHDVYLDEFRIEFNEDAGICHKGGNNQVTGGLVPPYIEPITIRFTDPVSAVGARNIGTSYIIDMTVFAANRAIALVESEDNRTTNDAFMGLSVPLPAIDSVRFNLVFVPGALAIDDLMFTRNSFVH